VGTAESRRSEEIHRRSSRKTADIPLSAEIIRRPQDAFLYTSRALYADNPSECIQTAPHILR